MKDGKFNGSGTTYYPDGSILYDGEWKNGLYHGQGTLYNEDGTISYSGKWEKDDYAS